MDRRHEIYRTLLTWGVIAGSIISVVAPHLTHYAHAVTVATAVCWLWE